MNKEEYVGKFEILNLTQSQKKQLKGNLLIRYEYRRFSNLRCIFVREYDYNYNRYKYIFLCAFNEDASKKKGNNSYSYNIQRAISIFENI